MLLQTKTVNTSNTKMSNSNIIAISILFIFFFLIFLYYVIPISITGCSEKLRKIRERQEKYKRKLENFNKIKTSVNNSFDKNPNVSKNLLISHLNNSIASEYYSLDDKDKKFFNRITHKFEKFSNNNKITTYIDKKDTKYSNKLTELYEKQKEYYKILADSIKTKLVIILENDKGDLIANDTERADSINRLKKCDISETVDINEGTYTINKEHVYLCDPNFEDENTLVHVLVHEYGHVINDTYGHDKKWRTLFDKLLQIACKNGWHHCDRKLRLDTYCGAKYHN